MAEVKKWTLQIGGRDLTIETGMLAKQASGSVRVSYGDTVVLGAATMSKGPSYISGYFPLMVDYEERFYASGKIKGSRFVKREGRPTDEAVLTGRLIDRTIRPLFDMRMRNDVQVVVTVLSIDQENDPDIVSIIAASAALHISNIPWNGPVAAVRVGMTGDELVLNPVQSERVDSMLDLAVSGTKDKINMVEAGAREVSEEKVVEGFELGMKAIEKIAGFIEQIRAEAGKEKSVPVMLSWEEDFEKSVRGILEEQKYEDALYSQEDKMVKYERLSEIREAVFAFIKENVPEENRGKMKEAAEIIIDTVADELVHTNILERDLRPDHRALTQIRPINCQAGILPRTHGTGLFTRGETQVLSVATLGAPGLEQLLDSMEETDVKKRYMHHYNFPAFSVGEVRPNRGPGRREIGHGALAERAIEVLMPSKEDFPYAVRVVSEVLESNGSSSMASVCGSTLALMDAGVPIKAPASGIAMGIIIDQRPTTNDQKQNFKVLTDIQGLEDHFGDMDFKIAGTRAGITALQMDVKVDGVNTEMLSAVLAQSHTNRMEILDMIAEVLPAPRKEMSPYAPRIITIHINPEKIRDVIGPGGKMINQIIDETGVEIDIEDSGLVFITSVDEMSAKKAEEWVRNIVREVKAGEVFQGQVKRIMNFGAFVEILPNQEGLVHISELSDKRVERVEDVVNVGDMVSVKVKEIDNQGRVNLTMKNVTSAQ
jgi:polyribonucleotide nucleotidyltransferase